MPPDSVSQQGVPAISFREDFLSASRALRRAMASTLSAALCDPSYPAEVARALGLDKSLAWKACRIVTDNDPAKIAERLPGRQGVRQLVKALAARGADAEQLRDLENAVQRLRNVTSQHADDKDALAAMLNSVADSDIDRSESLRKMSFGGNSAIWGVRAAVQISLHFIAPAANPTRPGMLDLALVGGLVDFQRTRHNVPWAASTIRRIRGEDELPSGGSHCEAIDREGLTNGVPLMRRFCSANIPQLSPVQLATGAVRLTMEPGEIGRSGMATVITGWQERNAVNMYRTPEDTSGEHFVLLNTPTELVVHDLYVHRSLDFAHFPELAVYSQLPGGPIYPRDRNESGRLSIDERWTSLGEPPDSITPEFSHHDALVSDVFEKMGWRRGDFIGLRYRLKYPPVPALATFRYALPEQPVSLST